MKSNFVYTVDDERAEVSLGDSRGLLSLDWIPVDAAALSVWGVAFKNG